MSQSNYPLWRELFWKLLLAVLVSTVLFLMTIEFYSIATTSSGTIDYNQVKIEAQLYDHWSLYAKALYHFKQLEIHNLLKHSNGVIKTLYIAMYVIFLIHIYTLFIERNIAYRYTKKIVFFTKNALLTLGTIGTMYSIARAMHGRATDTSNISDLIQVAFFDAVYTTIVGLSLFLLAIGINIFSKRGIV